MTVREYFLSNNYDDFIRYLEVRNGKPSCSYMAFYKSSNRFHDNAEKARTTPKGYQVHHIDNSIANLSNAKPLTKSYLDGIYTKDEIMNLESSENLVYVTILEHSICHYLLGEYKRAKSLAHKVGYKDLWHFANRWDIEYKQAKELLSYLLRGDYID